MFSNEEIKNFILKYGEKWFFPDFTNKLTWYVVTLGAGLIIVPQPVKILVINWFVDLFSLNSGLGVSLPSVETDTDNVVGLFLIFMALVHNIGYKYFWLKKSIFSHRVCQEKRIYDANLLDRFLDCIPSSSRSVRLLKEHDFGNSFNKGDLAELEKFYCNWNGAEYYFTDTEIDLKRGLLYDKCSFFLSKIGEYTIPVRASDFISVISESDRGIDWDLPDYVQGQIDELNRLSTEIYKQHQDFISFSKAKIQN
ncbi:hypothetical protein [Aeromonas salmonicida]|uniref:hypothetical protein n=1 Tax=Aeromonas salmonicida TaxID=645 RepID=UPI00285D63E2|nr:hypothetical protein [Aeromonas salmonicida]MDR7019581.1 hypothetical protein [Aeromonas salmonicida]